MANNKVLATVLKKGNSARISITALLTLRYLVRWSIQPAWWLMGHLLLPLPQRQHTLIGELSIPSPLIKSANAPSETLAL
jgi:hypothetical protein